ncbi:MAG: hypothetical protein PHF97_10575 [Bacteroidales bacterium]|nr:hypothetical protein [Bacteroidales bacterium]
MKWQFRYIYLFVVVALLFSSIAHAQKKDFSLTDPRIAEKYVAFDFNGKFVVSPEEDAVNHYYIVDISVFSTKFERVYFMNLTFTDDKIVDIDSDIVKKSVWFLAKRKFSVNAHGHEKNLGSISPLFLSL